MKKKIAIGIAAILITVLGLWNGYYQYKIYPGIQAAGVSLGGLTLSGAELKLKTALDRPAEYKLTWGNREWKIDPQSIDLNYQPEQTANKALAIGRTGSWNKNLSDIYTAYKIGQNVDPVFTLDEVKLNAVLASIAAEINIPAKEPEISFDKNSGGVVVTPGENGQEMDTQLLTQRILLAVKNVSIGPVGIPVMQLQPKLNDMQIHAAQTRAQKLIGKKIEIKNDSDGQTWELEDVQLLTWIDPQGNNWKNESISNWIAELAQNVDRPAENANFRIVGDGKVEEFKPGKEGLRVKQLDVVQQIIKALDALENGQQANTIDLVMEIAQPEVKTGDANNLGIKELIGSGESWFSGSIDNRIYNIQKATLALNGILVAPGETFSFNQKIGEISQATGYKPAYIIKDGKTILGDGGGVCQVSSTLFRAVLHTGLPITERAAHAYRVSYYEEKNEPGFDATVFQPNPDFKFVNDTPAYVLIQTNFDAVNKHVVFDFYGTNDGRQVTVSKARIWDITPPPPDLYQDDPNLQAGITRQIEHAAWGAKVAFDWKVTRGGEVLQDRTFYSNYVPWQAVFTRGTKQ